MCVNMHWFTTSSLSLHDDTLLEEGPNTLFLTKLFEFGGRTVTFAYRHCTVGVVINHNGTNCTLFFTFPELFWGYSCFGDWLQICADPRWKQIVYISHLLYTIPQVAPGPIFCSCSRPLYTHVCLCQTDVLVSHLVLLVIKQQLVVVYAAYDICVILWTSQK